MGALLSMYIFALFARDEIFMARFLATCKKRWSLHLQAPEWTHILPIFVALATVIPEHLVQGNSVGNGQGWHPISAQTILCRHNI